MQLTVSGLLNQFQRIMQGVLFPTLQEQLGPLGLKRWSVPGRAVWADQPSTGAPSPGPSWPKRCST